jgi:hypothetical protein
LTWGVVEASETLAIIYAVSGMSGVVINLPERNILGTGIVD